MDFIVSTLIIVAFVDLSLAGLVFIRGPRTEANRVFAISAAAIAGWVVTNAAFRIASTIAEAALWANLSYFCALVTGASFLHFVWTYPEPSKRATNTYKLVVWLISTTLSVLPFVPGLVIGTVELQPTRRIITTSGVYPIAAFIALTILGAFYVLWRNHRQARGTKRSQSRYVLVGAFLLTVFGLTFNLLLPLLGNYSLVWLGPASSILFVGFTVYSIVAHRLFDIRLIIQRALVYTLLLGLLIAGFAVAAMLLTSLLQSAASRFPFLQSPFVSSLVAALLIGFGVEPLRRWLVRVTDGFLFQQERRKQEILVSLSRKLGDALLEEDVLDTVMKAVEQAFRPRAAAVYLFGGQDVDEGLSVSHSKKLGGAALLHTGSRQLEDIVARHRQASNDALPLEEGVSAHLIDGRGAEAGRAGEMPRGVLLLGPKRSGRRYDEGDEELLGAILAQASSALHRASLYDGDRKKTEFVSIAAHELLTPIAAIEGYLSMLVDEHLGQVDERADGYLRKVYASTHRLHALVKDLLSVSRLEAGRAKFSPVEVDMDKLIGDAVDQLELLAQDKGLQLVHLAPTVPLPSAYADPDKVVEVLVNLIGNAIKYTPKGKVTVSARASRSSSRQEIEVSVADTGLGMSRKAREHLFEKFYRIATPETSAIQGTGLGLYITKAIVEKMGGSIEVESAFGKGSNFSFTLPCSPAEK